MNKNEITIKGEVYIRKDSLPQITLTNAVIIRSESAGCFFGNLKSKNLKDGIVELENARRIWYWEGAASLSQLAVDGTSKPGKCKFPCAVPIIEIAKVIEVIPMTETALASLNTVKVWQQ